MESLKESTAETVRDSALAQQRLHQTSVTLEAEVVRLDAQNKELKEGFTKMRDQGRLTFDPKASYDTPSYTEITCCNPDRPLF